MARVTQDDALYALHTSLPKIARELERANKLKAWELRQGLGSRKIDTEEHKQLDNIMED